ncbi:S8 family serine peptidase [Roseomonas sp. CECT 9278]|uniref:S8 family serine peptidase n=1 Tax=Roseomonas sp. CECT 9278 TaxID=2845823 RepID=UPI001E4DD427|nr:S8 family serine peptidase [Roseomonas sp. CECT 9278]CAH0279488.1 hypothetical protein ROS9278_03901 [Roseomonas sp. CECT 9278]
MSPSDPLYGTQWHLKLIGNIETIWNEYDGKGVTVGVYDDGVEAGHPDLAPNYDASLHLLDDLGNALPPVPVAVRDGHGTAVAGIIGAAKNGIGGVGVAWGVTLTGVNIDYNDTGLYGSISAADITGFRHLVHQGAAFDIASNSWGATPLYQSYQSLAGGDFDDYVEQSYGDISAIGRGGLGTIIVMSAGNDDLDANGTGLNASRFTITVAATEPDGMASSYSNFGASILVAAPAADVTTDLSGDERHPLDEVLVDSYAAPSFVDIDNDGDIDAVLGTMGGALRTYVNNDGVFAEATGAANPFGALDFEGHSSPSFGDVDNDGDLDAVVGDVSGALRTFINTAGVFTEVTGASNPFDGLGVNSYSSPSLADIDGDGDIDAVVGNLDGTLTTFINNAGDFTELTGAANPFDGVNIGPVSVPSFVDLDGDGMMDLVVGSEDGRLRLFQNGGTGVFTELTGAANPFAAVLVPRYSKPGFGDIDGDGDIDAIVGDWNGALYGYLNDGTGVFTEQVRRGFDATGYTERFGGTSAAAPIVSGVVALMLEANPGLGWRDVQDILAASATLTGSAFGAGPSSVEDGTWQANGAATWNGGGYHLHANYGYGMVNAYNAVRMAEVWNLFGAAETSANEVSVQSGLNDFADTVVPEGAGSFSTTFTIAGDVEIDHVALHLDFESEGIGDLQVELTSASGTVIRAAVPSPYDQGPDAAGEWIYGIEGFRGELSAGTWTLTVTDPLLDFTTTVRSAALDIYGSVLSARDVYHFTDEYLTMRGLEGGRGTIGDANGGIDWLDFAAVTGSIAIDLAVGRVVGVGGVVWSTLSGAFENAVTGDGNDTLTGTAVGNVLSGMRGDDSLLGNGGADTLHGQAGNDTLDGGLGNDTMIGGGGHDIYVVNAPGDRVFETATTASLVDAGGIDTVQSAVSFNLDANATVRFVERLMLTGTADINGTGNGLANILTGNAGNNLLKGGLGNDTLNGGAGGDTLDGGAGTERLVGGLGDDVYMLDATADVVVEFANQGIDTIRTARAALTLAANLENIAAIGATAHAFTGNTLANALTGAAGADTLNGGAGNDTLDGGLGSDRLAGSIGDDLYLTSAATDVVVELLNQGTDTVLTTSAAYTLGLDVEHLTAANAIAHALTGNAAANRITGNALADTLTGAAGNDTLDGGAGIDRLVGGLNNDLYIATAGDVVVEAANQGVDTVRAMTGTAFSLNVASSVGVEHLVLAGATLLAGTGNALGNAITGNAAANTLTGLNGHDSLMGEGGADTLVGGLGRDTMAGGAGADRFRFDATAESTLALPDLITDFTQGQDRIDLRGIDGNLAAALTYVAGAPVAAGQVGVVATGANAWRVLVDLNGGGPDAAIDVISATGPAANWFLL